MRVFLVRPPFELDFYDAPHYVVEPLGIQYLASAIREEHEVKILDTVGEYWDKYYAISEKTVHMGANYSEIAARITQYNPDVVAISSLFYAQSPSAYNVASLVKKLDKDIKVIMGGGHPSAFPAQTMRKCKDIDFIVIGEGEETIKELLNKIDSPVSVKGIAYRIGNAIFQNEKRQLIEDIDSIKFPARDLVPYKNYPKTAAVQLKFKILSKMAKLMVNRDISDRLYYWIYNTVLHNLHKRIRLPAGSLISSRGCSQRCFFCSIQNVWGTRYRMRSAANVLDEMELMKDKYKLKHISVQDDNFTVNKKRTIEICKGIIYRGLDLTFNCPSGVYLPSLDRETLRWMKRAGFYELYFGVESGNQRVLNEVINKHQDLNKVKEIIRTCKELKIKTGGYFVVGMPGESIGDMRDTINFAANSELDVARLYTCQPFPGSKLYEDCVKNNYLTKQVSPDMMKIFEDKSYIRTKEFNAEDVERIIKEGREMISKMGKLGMPATVK